jgi:DNA-binding helix-hairpin-helix protein with protein kinase domain
MAAMLKPGQIVQTESSKLPCHIEEFLGGGGQGEVYRVRLNDKRMALKWYHPTWATPQQRKALETLVKKSAPSNHFLWPAELVSTAGVLGFGYLMPLREPRFKSIVDLMKRRIDPSFRVLATAGLHLAHGFWELHAQGMSYRDISFGNACFDPQTGDVLICDNDNATYDGQAVTGMKGTPRFMAPEIVRGEAEPSTETDRFSLAVLLFYMFLIHHPLEGEREAKIRSMDLPAMTELYGTKPVFIFDPQDASNRPVKGYQDNALIFWAIYPEFLKRLFTRSFTQGIRDPKNGRVIETEWRAAMVRLRDCLVPCARCRAENFHDPAVPLDPKAKVPTCWHCQKELVLPPYLRLGKNTHVVINADTKLFAHHLDRNKPYDFSQALAEVSRHPVHPDVLGLKNLGTVPWVTVAPDGRSMGVDPGRNVSLAPGTRIQFGQVDGEIFGPPARKA